MQHAVYAIAFAIPIGALKASDVQQHLFCIRDDFIRYENHMKKIAEMFVQK